MEHSVVAFGSRRVLGKAVRVQERLGALFTRPDASVRGARITAIDLPAKILELVCALDMPFAEVASSIAGLAKTLSPVRILRTQHGLVVVHGVFDLQHAVIVRQHAGHQARAGGGTGRQHRVCTVEPQPTRSDPVNVGSQAVAVRPDNVRSRRIGKKKKNVGTLLRHDRSWSLSELFVFPICPIRPIRLIRPA